MGIILKVWDDDSGHLFGVGHEDDLVDEIQYNIASISAQKDLQSATARTITVRALSRFFRQINPSDELAYQSLVQAGENYMKAC